MNRLHLTPYLAPESDSTRRNHGCHEDGSRQQRQCLERCWILRSTHSQLPPTPQSLLSWFLTSQVRSRDDISEGDFRKTLLRCQKDVFGEILKLVDEIERIAKKKKTSYLLRSLLRRSALRASSPASLPSCRSLALPGHLALSRTLLRSSPMTPNPNWPRSTIFLVGCPSLKIATADRSPSWWVCNATRTALLTKSTLWLNKADGRNRIALAQRPAMMAVSAKAKITMWTLLQSS